jgi:hypothetical protein
MPKDKNTKKILLKKYRITNPKLSRFDRAFARKVRTPVLLLLSEHVEEQ